MPADSSPDNRSAVYLIPVLPEPEGHVVFALRALQSLADRCVVISVPAFADRAREILGNRPSDVVLEYSTPKRSVAAGYKQALAWCRAQGPATGDLILTGMHVIGPILPLHPSALTLADPDENGQTADMFSAYWHNADLDIRLNAGKNLGLLPSLDFAVFSARVQNHPEFQSFWAKLEPSDNHWEELQRVRVGLVQVLNANQFSVVYPMPATSLATFDPSIAEIDKVLALGSPCLPVSVLRLDPILHDLYSTDLRLALNDLRQRKPDIYKLVVDYASRDVPPRDFAMASDQYEVLPHGAAEPLKTEWSFGRIAVFIHAYYAEMMPEFLELLKGIPSAFDLFISTSNGENQGTIIEYLKQNGFADDAFRVVVVEMNRGRDMSSLFITFREEVLSGKYEVALRLHSKRTPQVSRQVGENFKKYLFENLVGSRGYVSNILDKFEKEPDIGMIMPPVIHVGFGTLGHSWFNNFAPMTALAGKMGLKVRFDVDTPLAPLGTMYWFRPDALRKMFEWPWRWEDYNPEPRHIDGGLAHVQERLLCYVCVDRGYRIVMAMTSEQAGRSYAKLEYKLQLLSARLASGNISFQRDQLDQLRGQTRSVLLKRLMQIYGSIVRRYPGARKTLRPMGQMVRRILNWKI